MSKHVHILFWRHKTVLLSISYNFICFVAIYTSTSPDIWIKIFFWGHTLGPSAIRNGIIRRLKSPWIIGKLWRKVSPRSRRWKRLLTVNVEPILAGEGWSGMKLRHLIPHKLLTTPLLQIVICIIFDKAADSFLSPTHTVCRTPSWDGNYVDSRPLTPGVALLKESTWGPRCLGLFNGGHYFD